MRHSGPDGGFTDAGLIFGYPSAAMPDQTFFTLPEEFLLQLLAIETKCLFYRYISEHWGIQVNGRNRHNHLHR